jgi:hypothetical protein
MIRPFLEGGAAASQNGNETAGNQAGTPAPIPAGEDEPDALPRGTESPDFVRRPVDQPVPADR